METHVPPTEFNIELTQGGMKAAMKEAGATSRDLLMVPLDNIKIISGFNVRIHDADYDAFVESTKESIIQNGYYADKPLAGYAGKEGDLTFIYCAEGGTRLEAAKRARAAGAPIETIPVVLKPPGTSMIDLMVGVDVGNQNRPLKPYERAIVIKRLIGYGLDVATVASRLRISEQYVNELLYLMGLPKGLQDLVIAGKAGASDAVRLAKKVGPTEALRAFEASAAPGNGDTNGSGDDAGSEPVTGGASSPAGKAKVVIPKKTLFTAIDYAIGLPSEGIKWLKRWRESDADALAELAVYKPPRKNAKKASDKKTKANGAGKDPFDTGSGKRRGRPPKAKPDADATDAKPPAADDDPL